MTVTVNYGWDLPTVGGDTNTWGTALNVNLVAIDARLFAEIGTPRPINRGGTGGVTGAAAVTNFGITATIAQLNFVAGVTSAIQTQLNERAPLISPALTGVPTAPTAAPATNTTQLATTAFVTAAVAAGGGGHTLLGTITTTSGTVQTLSGLDLNPYVSLLIVLDGVSYAGGTNSRLELETVEISGAISPNVAVDGVAVCYLDSGYVLGTIGNASRAGTSAYSRATTSISITWQGTTFNAGSIKVYGVK